MKTNLAKLYSHLKNRIVSIEGMQEERESAQPQYRPFMMGPAEQPEEMIKRKISFGSGMIIHSKGYILTCYHVVQEMNEVRIKRGRNRALHHGKVVWCLPSYDLAVIRIYPRSPLPVVSFAKASPVIGDPVFAIGNPFGFEYTLTTGIVSGKNRTISTPDHQYDRVLQTDAALNPGNSGGPLFNHKGQVVGMNAVIVQSFQNVGFALSCEQFLPLIRRYAEG